MQKLSEFNLDMLDGAVNPEVSIQEIATKDLAIIGVAAQMPSADNLAEYWDNIRNGIDCIRKFPESRREDIDDYLHFTGGAEIQTQYIEAGYLDRIDQFDYRFFNLSPKEAGLMDPCQKIFLQTVWQAIEDAGYGGGRLSGTPTGIYLGFSSNLKDCYQKFVHEVDPSCIPLSWIGNLAAMIPSRISYLLDLTGPTMVVDTACSSALTAVHLAAQAIQNGDCEMAIAGGVKLNLLPVDDENFKFGVESSDYRTRAFADHSDGTGVGEGVAAVLLKPLNKALKDHDPVYAVLKASAINQDGGSMGLTVTNPVAQTNLLTKVWEKAGINPETISYIEAHGTGTKLGDPIEIDGICNAFRKYTDKKQFCAISSVKSNIGHLGECAGMASLLKAILALQKGEIPPSLYFNRPNRKIEFEDSPVYVNTKPRKWTGENGPRRCGISSFGISGTNCHLVLEEAPKPPVSKAPLSGGRHILTLSAKSELALERMIRNYREFLTGASRLEIADLCYTANTGRDHYQYRLALLIQDLAELRTSLDGLNLSDPESANSPVVFYHRPTTRTHLDESNERNLISKEEQKRRQETATATVDEYSAAGYQSDILLDEICRLYIDGAEIDWRKLYRENEVKKVSLPVYPFAPDRCWIQIGKPSGNIRQYHQIVWQPEAIDQASQPAPHQAIMIFKDQKGIGTELALKFRAQEKTVVEVEISEAYREISPESYTISGAEADYVKLFTALKGKGISQLIHLGSITQNPEVTSVAALAESQTRGVWSLFYLVRALIQVGVDNKLDLVLVAGNATEVNGTELHLHPENASLLGLGKVVGQEYPDLSCRGIDIDEETTATEILIELETKSPTYQAAYRNGTRYVEIFRESELCRMEYPENACARAKIRIKSEGVYVITGGTGGIGLEMAKYLASQTKVNLALINRTPMPDWERWNAIKETGTDIKLGKKIQAIQGIEASGSHVSCYGLDISKFDEVKTLFDELRRQFGAINGIIHSAGVMGNSFIVRRSEAAFQEVLDPKIQGTLVLDQVTQADQLDFFTLFSSGLSLMGEAGHGDYVAANAYLDSFAAYRQKQGKRTLTINWAAWKTVGTSVEYGVNVDRIFKAISTEQALAGFSKALQSEETRVIIAEMNYQGEEIYLLENPPFRLSPEIRAAIKAPAGQGRLGKNPKIKREAAPAGKVGLQGRETGAYSESEKQIAGLYHQLLGFDQINIYDNFFELGGDSLLIHRMYRELEKLYPGLVKVSDLFTYTSISRLAKYIVGKSESGAPKGLSKPGPSLENQLESIIDEMEKGQLNIDQVIAKVSEVGDSRK